MLGACMQSFFNDIDIFNSTLWMRTNLNFNSDIINCLLLMLSFDWILSICRFHTMVKKGSSFLGWVGPIGTLICLFYYCI